MTGPLRLTMIGAGSALFLAAFEPVAGGAADRDDIEFVIGSSLPPEAWDALAALKDHKVEARINPYYLQGDFDGDGHRDTAVLVLAGKTGKRGIALVLKGGRTAIIAAGRDLDGDDDLAWMDAWYVFPKSRVDQGATEERPPTLEGDAIAAIKTESASGLIYWDGRRFRWYQQGD